MSVFAKIAHLFGLRSCNPRHEKIFNYITNNMIMKGEIIQYILDDEMSHSNMDNIYLIYHNMLVHKIVLYMLENPHIISFLYSYNTPNALIHLILSLVEDEEEEIYNDDDNIDTIEYDRDHLENNSVRCEGHINNITFKKASNEYFKNISPDNISRFDFLKNYYYKGVIHSTHNSIQLLLSTQSYKIKFPVCTYSYFKYKKRNYITTTLDNLYVTFMGRIWNNITTLIISRDAILINKKFHINYKPWDNLCIYIKQVYMYIIQITSDQYGYLCILCNFYNYELQKIHNMLSKKYKGEGLTLCERSGIDVKIEGGGYEMDERYGYDIKYAGKWVLADIKINIGHKKYFNVDKIYKIVDFPENQLLPIFAQKKY